MNLNNAPRARPQVGQAAPHPQRTHGPPCIFMQPFAELALAISRPMAHTRPCSRRNRAHGMTPWSSPLLFTIDSPPPPGGGGGYNGANQPTTASEGNLPPACPRSGQTAQHPRQARGHTLSCAYARPFAEPALAILQTRGKHPPSLPRELRPRPDATGQRTTLHHRLLAPHPPTPSGRRRWWRRRQLYHHTLALAPEGTAPKARRR
jgi:hypothetical protein